MIISNRWKKNVPNLQNIVEFSEGNRRITVCLGKPSLSAVLLCLIGICTSRQRNHVDEIIRAGNPQCLGLKNCCVNFHNFPDVDIATLFYVTAYSVRDHRGDW